MTRKFLMVLSLNINEILLYPEKNYKTMEPILIAFSVLFGLGVALTTTALVLFYSVFFNSNNYSSPLIILAMSFLFLWLGTTLLFIVIA
jgi:hypothetical protein